MRRIGRYINFIYMGAPTVCAEKRRRLAGFGERKQGEGENEAASPKQLSIYTGGEYLAPVCKAFNGEASRRS